MYGNRSLRVSSSVLRSSSGPGSSDQGTDPSSRSGASQATKVWSRRNVSPRQLFQVRRWSVHKELVSACRWLLLGTSNCLTALAERHIDLHSKFFSSRMISVIYHSKLFGTQIPPNCVSLFVCFNAHKNRYDCKSFGYEVANHHKKYTI